MPSEKNITTSSQTLTTTVKLEKAPELLNNLLLQAKPEAQVYLSRKKMGFIVYPTDVLEIHLKDRVKPFRIDVNDIKTLRILSENGRVAEK